MATVEQRRAAMVDSQIVARGVASAPVLEAMRTVPREAFVAAELGEHAYEDRPLPIGAGQTISQPYIVALMIAAAEIRADDRILEVGAGSGYAAAVMSRLGRSVHAIERHEALAASARVRLDELGFDNVTIRTGDGTEGWAEAAPFDVILVAASGPAVPEPLRRQLAVGGRLIMPVGDDGEQQLIRLKRLSAAHYDQDALGPVRFVPLIGAYGWQDR